ncbi:carbonic anhydrase [Streptomyces sp. NPDC057301]|uniref:carbonic anhydrase n=1 Tax=Streptomyces sp. NPDC057301 TaxID=3346093 RepID=UPI00363901B2
MNGTLQRPDQGLDRRASVAQEQDPYGVIVSCIDSRVPPEMVFDTGIGALSAIRTGGQVVTPVVTGSVEYDPLTAGTSLILVLGHQRCGAVKASYSARKERKPLPGNLQSIAEAVRPAYEATVKGKHADPVEAMVRVPARQTAADLRRDPSLAPLVKKGDLARQRLLLPRHRPGGGPRRGSRRLTSGTWPRWPRYPRWRAEREPFASYDECGPGGGALRRLGRRPRATPASPPRRSRASARTSPRAGWGP